MIIATKLSKKQIEIIYANLQSLSGESTMFFSFNEGEYVRDADPAIYMDKDNVIITDRGSYLDNEEYYRNKLKIFCNITTLV